MELYPVTINIDMLYVHMNACLDNLSARILFFFVSYHFSIIEIKARYVGFNDSHLNNR